MIDIVIRREGGDVTHLKGQSGLATCMGELADDLRESDPPTISLRCSTAAELAWHCAVVMAAVRHANPRAYELAKGLMEFCNFDRPQLERRLPPL